MSDNNNDDAHRERLKEAAGLVLDLVQRLPRDFVPGLTTEEAALCLETAAKVVRQTEGWPAFLALDAGRIRPRFEGIRQVSFKAVEKTAVPALEAGAGCRQKEGD